MRGGDEGSCGEGLRGGVAGRDCGEGLRGGAAGRDCGEGLRGGDEKRRGREEEGEGYETNELITARFKDIVRGRFRRREHVAPSVQR